MTAQAEIQNAAWEAFAERPGRFALFGASAGGRSLLAFLREQGLAPLAFLDNARSGELEGLPVARPSAWRELGIERVAIGSMYGREMSAQLRRDGFGGAILDLSALHLERWRGHFDERLQRERAARIDAARARLADRASRACFDRLLRYRRTLAPEDLPAPTPQYRHPALPISAGEVVVNAGAFDGATSFDYAEAVGPGGRVHAFEPVDRNHRVLLDAIAASPIGERVVPWKFGLWSERARLRVDTGADNPMQFRVQRDGGEEIEVVALDEFARREALPRIDWIKMDIEGAEREALSGAARVLREGRTKLAICIYHRPDDLWELPLQMAELAPGAALYLGHHSQNLYESVCYALPA